MSSRILPIWGDATWYHCSTRIFPKTDGKSNLWYEPVCSRYLSNLMIWLFVERHWPNMKRVFVFVFLITPLSPQQEQRTLSYYSLLDSPVSSMPTPISVVNLCFDEMYRNGFGNSFVKIFDEFFCLEYWFTTVKLMKWDLCMG